MKRTQNYKYAHTGIVLRKVSRTQALNWWRWVFTAALQLVWAAGLLQRDNTVGMQCITNMANVILGTGQFPPCFLSPILVQICDGSTLTAPRLGKFLLELTGSMTRPRNFKHQLCLFLVKFQLFRVQWFISFNVQLPIVLVSHSLQG